MEETLIDLGVLIAEPADEYHARAGEYLNSHGLADFRKSPLLYRQRTLGIIPNDERPAYLIGDAAHCRILEGRDEFERRFAVGGPINPKTEKPYGGNTIKFAEWAAAQGKPVLTLEQAGLVENLAAGVARNQWAMELLGEGVAEGVARAEYCDVPCQIRIDWLNPREGIIDLKTLDDADFLVPDARRYGYVHQMSFYRSVLQAATGVLATVRVIGVEKKPPYRAGVWLVSPETLDQCRRENEAAIERLVECRRMDVWPDGYEEERVLCL